MMIKAARVNLNVLTMVRWLAIVTLVLTSIMFVASNAQAQDDSAAKILKAMSDYVANQKSISATFDTDIEVITPEVQKIQFTSSGKLMLSRPDKLRASRTGGYADVELIFDGKTVSVLGKDANAYAQTDASGTVDQLIDRLRNEFSLDLPGADILLSNAYEVLMEDVLDAKHIGQGVVNGVECEHLAFRNQDTDWQLWVAVGDRPFPCKYVITSKAVAGAPQYTLVIKDWKTDEANADAFVFQPPADAKNVDFSVLTDIDEIPAGIVKGN
jgi:hypothetical protein